MSGQCDGVRRASRAVVGCPHLKEGRRPHERPERAQERSDVVPGAVVADLDAATVDRLEPVLRRDHRQQLAERDARRELRQPRLGRADVRGAQHRLEPPGHVLLDLTRRETTQQAASGSVEAARVVPPAGGGSQRTMACRWAAAARRRAVIGDTVPTKAGLVAGVAAAAPPDLRPPAAGLRCDAAAVGRTTGLAGGGGALPASRGDRRAPAAILLAGNRATGVPLAATAADPVPGRGPGTAGEAACGCTLPIARGVVAEAGAAPGAAAAGEPGAARFPIPSRGDTTVRARGDGALAGLPFAARPAVDRGAAAAAAAAATRFPAAVRGLIAGGSSLALTCRTCVDAFQAGRAAAAVAAAPAAAGVVAAGGISRRVTQPALGRPRGQL